MGFPNGAPDLACKGMKPGHLPTTTSGTNPFMLNISSTTYKPGDTVTVGTQNSVDQEEEAVGEFVSLDSSIQKHVCGNSHSRTEVFPKQILVGCFLSCHYPGIDL
ncbi:hypothetical protein MAR_019163 [Mya arenaria]|uniref:Reelin domain-containing protein n=1 Tax=Mya arenaria TaxID=6604 RepID=A0ABY7EJA3_MYAAR|nr:hypothetical protein MAR_019163 [Mya arenaria]